MDDLLAILDKHKLKLADLFNQIDRDGSGAIDHDELRTLLMVMGVDISDPQKLKDLFSLLDVDGDGEIELHEFLERLQEIQRDRATQQAGVSRRTPVLKKHPMMQRKGENYQAYKAKLDEETQMLSGTLSDKIGSPRPASASARMQSPPRRPMSATVQRARNEAARKEAEAEESLRVPLAATQPNQKRNATRPPSAPHRHTERLAATAHKRRFAERKASAERIAIFAGVSIHVAVAALLRSKDDVAVATQQLMRDKLAHSGMVPRRPTSASTSANPATARMRVRPGSASSATDLPTVDEDGVPVVMWQSNTAKLEQHRRNVVSATAVAARVSKQTRSGAWMPVGFQVDVLEKATYSNDRNQVSK